MQLLWELSKYDTGMRWTNAVGKNGADGLAQLSIATNLQFAKNSVSVKQIKQSTRKQGMLV